MSVVSCHRKVLFSFFLSCNSLRQYRTVIHVFVDLQRFLQVNMGEWDPERCARWNLRTGVRVRVWVRALILSEGVREGAVETSPFVSKPSSARPCASFVDPRTTLPWSIKILPYCLTEGCGPPPWDRRKIRPSIFDPKLRGNLCLTWINVFVNF